MESPPPPTATAEQIILPHLDAAYNLARWLVRDPVLAEDVVQDAAVRALSYFTSFKGGDARAWLLRIVRNSAYSLLAARRQGATTTLDDGGAIEDGEIADTADNPEAALSRREGFARLDDALAALPADLRECLVLHELEELSYKRVAEITGVPIGTVMSRLWRARRALFGQQAEGDSR
nr:sigma-70 family RNA polymerase sigma factor [uncultured Rhodopila sp.]